MTLPTAGSLAQHARESRDEHGEPRDQRQRVRERQVEPVGRQHGAHDRDRVQHQRERGQPPPRGRARRASPGGCAATRRRRTGRRRPGAVKSWIRWRMTRAGSRARAVVLVYPMRTAALRAGGAVLPESPMLDNLTATTVARRQDAARRGAAHRRQHPGRAARGAPRAARGRRRAAGRPRLRRGREGQGARRGGRRLADAGPGADRRRAPRADRADGRRGARRCRSPRSRRR